MLNEVRTFSQCERIALKFARTFQETASHQAAQSNMSSSRFFAAAPAAAAAAAETQERPALSALRTRRLQKRKRAAAAEAEAEGDARQLTEMEKQVVALRRANADTLLLFECGYRMRIFADDAEV